jgi:hypothetical protein
MRTFTMLALLAGTLGLASIAEAGAFDRPCTSAPKNQWLSIEELQQKVEAQGYKVRKAKLKSACGELYATDKNGTRVELFVDPTNAAIIGTE